MSTELNKEMLVPSMSAVNEGKVYLISRAKAKTPSPVPGYGYINDNGFESDIGYSSDNGIMLFPKFGNIIGKRLYIIGPYKDTERTITSISLDHNQSGPPTTVIDLPVIGMDDDPDNILTYVDVLQDPNAADSVILIGPVADGTFVTTNKSISHNKDIPLAMTYRSVHFALYEIDNVGIRPLAVAENDINNESAASDLFISYKPIVVDLVSVMNALQSMDKTLTTAVSILNNHDGRIAIMEDNTIYIRKSVSEMGGTRVSDMMTQLSSDMKGVIADVKSNHDLLSIDRERSNLHIQATDKFDAESMAMLKEIKDKSRDVSVNYEPSYKVGNPKLNTLLQIGTLFVVIISLFKNKHKSN